MNRYGGTSAGLYGGAGTFLANPTISSPTISSPTIASPTFTGDITATGVTNERDFAAAMGLPYVLAQSSIPLIKISSGSVDANGVISAITALPLAYPHAFCYFPANILATSIAAGWHYCTFSTTTAGVAYLSTWNPALGTTPTVPSSPTAVTDGKGAYTGDTSAQGALITLPAGALGPNGFLEVWARSGHTTSASNKVLRIALGATNIVGPVFTTSTTAIFYGQAGNAGAEAKQNYSSHGTVGTAATATAGLLSTVNTAIASTVGFTHQNVLATDNAVIESYFARIRYGA